MVRRWVRRRRWRGSDGRRVFIVDGVRRTRGDVVNVDFDDDDRKASHDVLLTDVDDSEWTVTLELSRSDRSGAWLIDKLWCEEAY